jgi:hypothetical protein
VAGTCKCGNEPSVSTKCGEFLDWLRIGLLLRKDCAAWSILQGTMAYSLKGASAGGKTKGKKQKASYGRWPLAASAFSTTNHYLITSDTTEKDKSIRHIGGPRPPSGPLGPGNLYRFPPPTRQH